MMKLAVTALTLSLALNLSQASTNSTNRGLEFRKQLSLKNRIATKSVVARAAPKAQRRLINNGLTTEDDGPPGPDELDLQSPLARPRVYGKPKAVDEISDYIAIRLAIARVKALQKYNNIHANNA